jgi:hypothetical protein
MADKCRSHVIFNAVVAIFVTLAACFPVAANTANPENKSAEIYNNLPAKERQQIRDDVRYLMQRMKMDDQFPGLRDDYMKRMMKNMIYTITDAIRKQQGGQLSEQQIQQQAASKHDKWKLRFTERVKREITLEHYLDSVYIPMFLDIYSQEQLQETTQLYRSPAGKKLSARDDDILLRGNYFFSKKILPDMDRIAKQTLDSDVQQYIQATQDLIHRLLENEQAGR